jgi:exosome complex RNA-binding protein Csl4
MKPGDLVRIRTIDDTLRELYNTSPRPPKVGVVVALRSRAGCQYADVLVDGTIDAGVPEYYLQVIDEAG